LKNIDLSVEHAVSIFRVKEYLEMEAADSSELSKKYQIVHGVISRKTAGVICDSPHCEELKSHNCNL
jgi:hypothetical protein